MNEKVDLVVLIYQMSFHVKINDAICRRKKTNIFTLLIDTIEAKEFFSPLYHIIVYIS